MKHWFKKNILSVVLLNLSLIAEADTIDTSDQEPFEQCGYCHEYDGNSKMPSYPRLAGQKPEYIVKQLKDFRSGKRVSQMQATAELLSNDDINLVANYFSQQAVLNKKHSKLPDSQWQLAEHMYFEGNIERGIRACASCHGQSALGNGNIPRLAGQHETYLYNQLVLFRTGARNNDDQGQMQEISKRLNEKEIQALVAYLARLLPKG